MRSRRFTSPASAAMTAVVAAVVLSAAPAPASAKAMAGGTIVPSTFLDAAQVADPNNPWTQASWDQEFSYFKAAGITEVILNGAVSANGSAQTAYYPSSIPGAVQARTASGTPVDVVTPLLKEARQNGIHVWLGTYIPDSNWYNGTPTVPQMLSANQKATQAVMTDLNAKYGSYTDVVSGWYLSSEVSAAWPWTPSSGASLGSYYAGLIKTARGLTLTQKTMIAPYCNVEALPPGTAWQDMWTQVLTAAPLDVIALQDGTGDGMRDASGNVVWRTPALDVQQLTLKYSTTRAAITAAKTPTQLWSDLDYYDVFGVMKPIGETAAVVDTVAPYVDKFTAWSFSGQYSPMKLGTDTYFKPFVQWNTTGALPGAPTTPTGLTSRTTAGQTTVSWSPSTAAPGNYMAFYRAFKADGITALADVFADPRTGLSFTSTQPCVVVRALDTAGNASGPASSCAGS